jgi:ACS family hexuronate transporter-like MFS transporter
MALPLAGKRQWWIVGLLCASIAINLVDRQVLSVVAPVLREEFFLSNTQYSYIIFAFQLGLLLGQVPAGLLLDLAGARLGLIIIFVSWSMVNALHGLSRGLAALVGLRFLLGLSECGNYSGGIKVIAGLFPAEQRALAGGVFNGGAQLGAVLAPPLVVFMTLRWGWRAAFLLPSTLGLLWLLPWIKMFPAEGTRGKKACGSLAEAHASPRARIPVRKILANPQVRGLMLFRAVNGPLTSFYWYWLPEYLRHGRGMSLVAVGMLAWIPYVAGGIGNVLGGYFADRLVRWGGSEDRARKTSFVVGALFSCLSFTLPFVSGTALAMAVICLIVFGNQWMTATYIGMVGDIFSPDIVATVNGLGGVADSGMGMITMLLTGILIDYFSYFPVLMAAALFPWLAVLSIYLIVRRNCSGEDSR